MFINLQRYIGQTVDIIYVDRKEQITKRTIQVNEIEGESIKAFCLGKNSPRTFRLDHILSAMPTTREDVTTWS
ncbi:MULTISPECIES: hypothetical protein [Paenibacillus]|uniref:hypothetical protein n=1 Tax=Paenibacillus TaxID=44249 RepID=UPI001C30C192|nr:MULTISPECIES: hypothetical protein [Paenibacillus]GKS15075.1 hypothetical protein YDYSY3_60750 [Paenibacillus chitinolyticus]